MRADGDGKAVLRKNMEIIGKYLQTWKLKLSSTETLSSISTTRKLNVSWKSISTTKPFAPSPNTSGQRWTECSRIADTTNHFAKADFKRRTLEAACWFQLEYWSNNVANNHSKPGPFINRALHSCLELLCSHPPNWSYRRLANCDGIQVSHQRAIFLSTQTSNLLSFVAKDPHCL